MYLMDINFYVQSMQSYCQQPEKRKKSKLELENKLLLLIQFYIPYRITKTLGLPIDAIYGNWRMRGVGAVQGRKNHRLNPNIAPQDIYRLQNSI